MTTLRKRILGALRLQPMTISQLARCLWANPNYVQNQLAAMRVKHVVKHVGRVRCEADKPHYLWGIV